MTDRLLTPRAAARLAGITPATIRAHATAGRLHQRVIAGRRGYRESDVRQATAPRPPAVGESRTLRHTVALLAAAGGTPEHITRTLAGAGVTGHRWSTSDGHPLVRWLRQRGARLDVVMVTDRSLLVWLVQHATASEIPLPLPLVHWCHRWERGDYPALEVAK